MRSIRGTTLLAAALAATLLAAGCGGSDDTSSGSSPSNSPAASASTAVNDADTTFVQMMIPHHEEAVKMAELAGTRAADAEVKELATKIVSAQNSEVETLKGWLTEWGADQPSGGDMGHDMGSMDMPGAMSDEDMVKLESGSGAAFDSLWLTMMTAHHEGAITMATDEIAEGANPDAKTFAQKVIDDQQAEIETMKKIQARL